MALTVAVIGSIMMDITVQTPRLPISGENLFVDNLVTGAGGKGGNAAVALARHGVRTIFVGNVGGDIWGREACRELQQAGVETNLIAQDAQTPTGMVIMLAEDNGLTTYVAYTGANRTLTPEDVQQRLPPLLRQLDGLLFNFEPPAAALKEAATLARAAGVPIFIDAGPQRTYSTEVWKHASILSPNESEAQTLAGRSLPDDESALVVARTLLDRGPQAVVLKRGVRGALWADDSGNGLAPAFPAEVIDPAGAGDAFTAGLVWATLSGHSLPDAVRWANACGALAATRLGTLNAMPTDTEVEAFLTAHT
ncbi:MAG TPA: ribokinase [Candidatus Sulfomarinibacteraceae bacterium]|nr:ribokinase [Candidatus Sulfomarinibacteraceae bacterium]